MALKYILIILLIQFGCSKKITELDKLNKENPIGLYGDKLSNSLVYKVSDILDYPETKIGKTIMVSGIISEVCPMRGCWMQISDDNSEEFIRVKVTDGEIVFPLSAKGKTVIAEGQFVKLELSEKQAKGWKHHLAAEKGIELDTTNLILNETDYFEFRLNTNSAEIF